MPDQSEKVRGNRLRRMAERQGYAVRKLRRRDWRALDYDAIWLMQFYVETPTGIEALADPEGSYDAWLGPFRGWDELEEWLTADPDARPNLEHRRQAGEYWLVDW